MTDVVNSYWLLLGPGLVFVLGIVEKALDGERSRATFLLIARKLSELAKGFRNIARRRNERVKSLEITGRQAMRSVGFESKWLSKEKAEARSSKRHSGISIYIPFVQLDLDSQINVYELALQIRSTLPDAKEYCFRLGYFLPDFVSSKTINPHLNFYVGHWSVGYNLGFGSELHFIIFHSSKIRY